MSTDPSTTRSSRRDGLLTFDRWDRLGLRSLLWLVAVAAIGMFVVSPLVDWARGEPLRVPFSSEVEVPGLAGTGLDHGEAAYDLLLDDPSAGQRLAGLVSGILFAAIVVACVVLVLRVMKPIGAGDPFAPHQVGRLRAIAMLLFLGVPVGMIVQQVLVGVVLGGLDLGELDFGVVVTIPWLPMTVGLCVALLAEAFKIGSGLRDDVEGLV